MVAIQNQLVHSFVGAVMVFGRTFLVGTDMAHHIATLDFEENRSSCPAAAAQRRGLYMARRHDEVEMEGIQTWS